MPRRDVSVVQRPADCDVALEGHGHRREDGRAEADVVQRVDHERKQVNEQHARKIERPGKKGEEKWECDIWCVVCVQNLYMGSVELIFTRVCPGER